MPLRCNVESEIRRTAARFVACTGRIHVAKKNGNQMGNLPWVPAKEPDLWIFFCDFGKKLLFSSQRWCRPSVVGRYKQRGPSPPLRCKLAEFPRELLECDFG